MILDKVRDETVGAVTSASSPGPVIATIVEPVQVNGLVPLLLSDTSAIHSLPACGVEPAETPTLKVADDPIPTFQFANVDANLWA